MRIVEMTSENRNEALRFLKAYEGRCVSLVERALRGRGNIFLLVEDKTTIAGVFSLSNSGSLLHCLPFAQKLSVRSKKRIGEATELLSPFLAERGVFCINGEADGSELLENAVRLAGVDKVLEAREYYRMEYEAERDTFSRREAEFAELEREAQEKEERASLYGIEYSAEKPTESVDGTVALKNTGEIVKCSTKDLMFLLSMEEEYQKNEVLPTGIEFNADSCRLGLAGKLRLQDVYADKIGDEYVAKAYTSAKGVNWVQIGGVYTKPLYRKLGIAGKLVSHIARKAAEGGKQTALFVRELNTRAVHSYERAGFVKKGSWRIVYFTQDVS